MLHHRLILLTLTTLVAAACSGGAIEENVVRPGITAITEDAPAAACAANAGVLRAAIESYTLLEGDPPPDEQALIDAGYLRGATTDWDVVDGELVAEDPACGDVEDVPITTLDIVTEAEPLDADEVYRSLDDAAIESLGGEACARELAAIVAAAETFLSARGAEPADLEELVREGYLEGAPERWELVGAQLLPVDGSGCNLLE